MGSRKLARGVATLVGVLSLAGVGGIGLGGSAAWGQAVNKQPSALDALALRSERLKPARAVAKLDEVSGLLPATVVSGWDSFQRAAGGSWVGYADRRTGSLTYAEGSGLPWIPGYGNRLTKAAAKGEGKVDLAALEAIARNFVTQHAAALGVDPLELVLNAGRSGHPSDYLWFVDFDVVRGGMPIEGARVFFRVNNGNLVQFGSENLPPLAATVPTQRIDRERALAILGLYVGSFGISDRFLDRGSQVLLTVGAGDPRSTSDFEVGRGSALQLAWQFTFQREGVRGTYRARVSAVNGEVLEFANLVHHADAAVRGGVFNEATSGEFNWPMPFADISILPNVTDSGGIYNWTAGSVNSSLDSTFVRIDDSNCGSINLTSGGGGLLDFGTSGGHDCTTPGVGGAGNTHAARTQFYQVNRVKEVGRGWLPANAWLNGQLVVNVNLPFTCNAFWDGATLNFYVSGGGCGNTGESTAVSIHEYGHGLDDNDGIAIWDTGTTESYADTTAFIQTHTSCIGNGFFDAGNCSGYGDACTSCSGIRDVDWMKHASGVAHTPDNFTRWNCGGGGGPCNREGHCESYVPSEAIWDFAERDFPSAGSNGAWATLERLWYLSRSTATEAFSCTPVGNPWQSDGCAAGTLWRTMRAVDDDDGNLTNGTPHSGALFAAFDRHEIACATDAGASTSFSGCTPPSVPTLTVTPGASQMSLSWTNSGGGIVYDVYRNETGCDSGFAKIAEDVATTSFIDTQTNALSSYFYQVIAHPSGNEACAAVPTACTAATVLSGTDLWSKDKPWDTGLEPDPATAADNMWESEDIWIRRNQTAGPHQDPLLGSINYAHVLWKNEGPATAVNAVVEVYISPAGTGLSWPSDWTKIGSGVITSLASGASTEVVIPWIPDVTGHVCMIARLVTPQDPMTFAETADVNYNTRQNNNIVWRNLNVVLMFGNPGGGNVQVHNVLHEMRMTRLKIRDRLDRGVRTNFLKRGRVLLTIGAPLMQRWIQGGRLGQGYRVIDDQTIEFLPLGGKLGDPYIDVKLMADEKIPMKIQFLDTARTTDPRTIDQHVIELRQEDVEKKQVVGGVTYQIQAYKAL